MPVCALGIGGPISMAESPVQRLNRRMSRDRSQDQRWSDQGLFHQLINGFFVGAITPIDPNFLGHPSNYILNHIVKLYLMTDPWDRYLHERLIYMFKLVGKYTNPMDPNIEQCNSTQLQFPLSQISSIMAGQATPMWGTPMRNKALRRPY